MYSYPVEYGAVGPLYAAGSPEAAQHNGKVCFCQWTAGMRADDVNVRWMCLQYLKPWATLAQPTPFALNAQEQDKLWTWLEEQVHGYV